MGERGIRVWAPGGIPEVAAGDDLARLVGDALAADEDGCRDGDILVVTSKIVSKAEGRFVTAADREQAITAETVRVVARRGSTRIVENRLGIVGAAAGVDASNTPEGTVLLLPVDPDASARRLCAALRARFGVRLGVIVSDTLGRAWRIGQTDIAIGAAGVAVVDDLRGRTDAEGRPLAVTVPVVADELAAAADLVKGKAARLPVAVVRGAGRLVTDDVDTPGARTLPRTGPSDMFRLGTDEALAEGRAAGYAEGLAAGRAEGLAEGRPPACRDPTRAWDDGAMDVLSSRILLRPTDPRRTRAFYRDVLGLGVYREFGPPDAPGTVFFIGGGLLEVSGRADAAPAPSVALWLQVRDVAREHARLVEAGVVSLREPRVEPWGLIEAHVADPDGLRIHLVEVPDEHPLRRDPR